MIIDGKTRLPLSDEIIKKYLKIGNIIMHPTWLTKKSVYVNMGMYRNFPAVQDYEFLTRIVLAGYRLGNVREPYAFLNSDVDRKNRRLLKSFTGIMKGGGNTVVIANGVCISSWESMRS